MIKRKIDSAIEPLRINQISAKIGQCLKQKDLPEPFVVKPKKINKKAIVQEKNTKNIVCPSIKEHHYTKSQDYQEILQQSNRKERQKSIRNKGTPIYQLFQSSNKENIDSKIDESSFSVNNIQLLPKELCSKGEASQVNYWMSVAKKYHNLLTSEKIKSKNLEQKIKNLAENSKYQNKVEIQQLQRKIETLNSQVISKSKQIREKEDIIARFLTKKQYQNM